MSETIGNVFSLTVFRETNGEEYAGLLFKAFEKHDTSQRPDLIPMGFISRTGHPAATTEPQSFNVDSGIWCYQPCSPDEAAAYEASFPNGKGLSIAVMEVRPMSESDQLTELHAAEIAAQVLLAELDTPESIFDGALLTLAGVAKAVMNTQGVDAAAWLLKKLDDALIPTVAGVQRAGGADLTPVYSALRYILEDYVRTGVNAGNLHTFKPHTQAIARELMGERAPVAAGEPVYH